MYYTEEPYSLKAAWIYASREHCSPSYSPVSRNLKKSRIYIVNRIHFTRTVRMEFTIHFKKYIDVKTVTWECILTFIINLLSIESICFFGIKIIGSIKRSILPFHMYNTFIVCFATSASVFANLYFFVHT